MKASTKIFLPIIIYTSLITFLFQNSYAQLVSDFRVNDDSTNTSQYGAKIGVDGSGNISIVWSDNRNERSNVYCQRLNSNGLFNGSNFRININPDTSLLPDVAVSKNGNFAVCWLDVNNNGVIITKVKCRLFDYNGNPLTDEILINDTLGQIINNPSISVNNNNYVITWDFKDILFQRIDSTGKKIGSNTKVNDVSLGNLYHRNPNISVRKDGSFIITWQDSRPPAPQNSEDIYMQMFSKNGTPIGNNVKVSDDTVRYNKQSEAKISSDTSGRFCISFTEFILNEVQSNIVCQLYNPDGSRQGNNFNIAGSIISEFGGVIFKKENGDMVSGYSYYSNRYEPYFQRINSQGVLTGNGFLLSSEFIFAEKYYNDIVVWKDRIISVWSDRRNTDLDVYCNIRSYSNPDSTVSIQNISTEIPNEFNLFQNYPNPFNNTTQIRFDIYNEDHYSLSVYNNLGQKVKEIFKNNLSPGSYKFSFESGDLSSGVYQYILSSPKERLVKSFVLLK